MSNSHEIKARQAGWLPVDEISDATWRHVKKLYADPEDIRFVRLDQGKLANCIYDFDAETWESVCEYNEEDH